jgi:cystathionine beta-lyase/cystathionine gamma-synthase
VTDQPASEERPPLRPESIAIRSGRSANGSAMSTPLWSSTVWASDSVDAARRAASGTRAEKFYARYANPTVNAFEEAVAALEGAEAALAFGSGMGAIASVVMALCSPGDHIVAQQHLYSGTQIFLQAVCSRFGIDVTFVDGRVPGAFRDAVVRGRTMLVLAECPANPQMSLVDLDELGAIAGPITVVDSTLATPYIQQPHRHGVDLVVHSATKGICGHNDATLGVVSGEADLIGDIWRYAVLHGAVASPFDALNGLRGLRTLPVRLARQSETARRLTSFLEHHDAVAVVHYPGLSSHPQADLAKKQMADTGSLFSIELTGGGAAARRFAERLSLAQLATSLGGPETLVTVPALSTHVGLSPEEKEAAGISDGLVRVSVGLEHADDLLTDFAYALSGESSANE